MKLYYDAAYGLLFICAGLGIGYFDAYVIGVRADASFFTELRNCHPRFPAFLDYVLPLGHADLGTNLYIRIRQETTPPI